MRHEVGRVCRDHAALPEVVTRIRSDSDRIAGGHALGWRSPPADKSVPRLTAAKMIRMPATRPPIRRLLWTIGRLRSGRPLKATDVAEQFGVAVRTAYRDLDFLRDQCQAPLEYDH